ncbi:GNAT family N-acetyltransferase [candidate division GN15 bacterium]|nr:GNAT family N-acetyltransferase [candidate division GN15 bacterium]
MRSGGYASVEYARSFRCFGDVLTLTRSGLSVIRRAIPGTDLCDCTGLYPYSVATEWSALAADIDELRALGAVSLSMVVDPFERDAAVSAVQDWTVARPFKTHFVVDLRRDWRGERAKNTRNSASRALRLHHIETLYGHREWSNTFWNLYQNTVTRHGVVGIQRMSEAVIAEQLDAPGCRVTAAWHDGRVLGVLMTFIRQRWAELHLVGVDEAGFRLNTSYGLIHAALEMAEGVGCTHANLGGCAGLAEDENDGLYQFKKRWARERLHTVLCGLILDPSKYEALVATNDVEDCSFFPEYRAPGGRYEWHVSGG